MTTKYTALNGNSTTNAANIKAILTGNHSATGWPEYQLLEMADGATLVASSYSPLADACRALRARGEARSLNVTVHTARVDGVYVPSDSGLISYGYGANRGQ